MLVEDNRVLHRRLSFGWLGAVFVYLLLEQVINRMLAADLAAVGFASAAVGQQPTRALGHEAAHTEDDQPEHGADAEGDAPAEIGAEDVGIKHDEGARRTNAAPIQELPSMTSGLAAHPRGDELLDRRVDRGVLAANAGAGEEPEEGIAPASSTRRR